MCGCNLVTPRLSAGPQRPRQLGDVGGGEELGRCSPSRLILEIDVGERLTVGVRATKMRLGLPARAAFY
jgi:hypothetical protein